ncbi:unnamed protein product [Rotaria sordida]|uniref:Uncharacterized protein n=1 Tax=Rotaria sordida TaxID=392033 RepID=A0A818QPZ8_9BILA|nr:unnamed protein product [Rotaria sordida]CAF3644759.1 unnamed protein product [Rotaria sordida]
MSETEPIKNNTDIAHNFPSHDIFHHHACLTLNRTDRLRLIRFPTTIISVVRQAILSSWHRGLQNEKHYAGAYQFKLYGNPWLGQGREAVDMSVLSALHHHGWYLVMATDVSKKQEDKDLLIFRAGIPPQPTSFFAVSFNERNKLRLIGAPYKVISAVQETIGTSRIQYEDWIYSETAYQFKLYVTLLFLFSDPHKFVTCRCGYPWTADGYETVTSRMIILDLLDCFTSLGWQLHASINMSTSYDGCHTDTWFFRRSNQ